MSYFMRRLIELTNDLVYFGGFGNNLSAFSEDNGNNLEFHVPLMNCQSMCNKQNKTVDYVNDHDVDIDDIILEVKITTVKVNCLSLWM